MDKKREEFLARLRETFRVEAAEHIDAMTAGLVALERANDVERPPAVERVFREAHSLKGAARAVNLVAAEALCQELESIFAALKSEEFRASTGMLDAVHAALAVLATACGTNGPSATPDTTEAEQQALAALRRIVRGTADVRAEAPPVAVVSEPRRVLETSAGPAASMPRASPDSPASGNAKAAAAPDTVRVSTQKLSAILRESEELVGARIAGAGRAAELRALATDLAGWNRGRLREAGWQRGRLEHAAAAAERLASEMLYTKALEHSLRKLAGAAHQDALSLAAIAERLVDSTRELLLLPCSYLFGALPKVLRDLAREHGKEAELLVSGEDIEVDRRVLDEMKDPIIHLLRNCVDHGIETPDARRSRGKPARGTVTITVRPAEGNRVELTVADDGSGIDAGEVGRAAVRLGLMSADDAARLSEADLLGLACRSGLSTSPIITDLSGRGLGLAIVSEKVAKLGGTITLRSTLGAGTAFRMLLPLSLASFRGVFVGVAGRRFVIPAASVVRVSRIKPGEIKTVENRQTLTLGQQVLSLVRLQEVLEISGPDRANGTARPVVVVRAAERQVAFLVDDVEGEQEVMVKSLGPQLTRVRNVAGVSLAGNGVIVPILDAADLVESAATVGGRGSSAAVEDARPARRPRLLIAEDSITARTLVKSILECAGYEVVATVDGLDALTRLKSEPFELVVSDVDMPRMNGFELTGRIRADKNLSRLPVVLVTALGSQQDREYGIEVGANAYIVKSDFDQGNLLEIVRRLLSSPVGERP